MGVVYSRVVRQVQRFNVENRAFRAIERKEPVSAPKHPTTTKYYEETINKKDLTSQNLQIKNVKLDGYLKEVYVSSTGMTPEIPRDKSKLPVNKGPVEENEYGFWQPTEIEKGKASLGSILKFISDNQGDPLLWNSGFIAKEYGLKESDVANVLEYYKTFNVYIPKVAKPTGGFFSLEDLKPINILNGGPPEPPPPPAPSPPEKPKDKLE